MNNLRSNSELRWEVFRFAATRVAAYRDFLKQQGVHPQKISQWSDIPIMDKTNYIKFYPLKDRAADPAQIIAMSSGTSGEPTFWPRGERQEHEQIEIHEMLYRTYFEIHRGYRTLMLIGFPMGIYVSGIATLIPSIAIARKYPNLTVVPVGNRQGELLSVLKNLAGDYEQIALIGHPFIMKDVLEQAKLKHPRVRIMTCSEAFSEDWQAYVEKLVRPRAKIFNTYGSSELLLMGWELPGKNGYHYDPKKLFVEEVNGELLFTRFSGVPLIRYNLHDAGTVKNNVITLKGRSDHTVIFYAANIYPEHIRAGLNRKAWYGKLTGKFVMHKKYLRNRDEILEINIELRAGVKPSANLTHDIQKNIVATLTKINMEYVDISRRFGDRVIPRVNLLPYQEKTYFPLGLKPRYIY